MVDEMIKFRNLLDKNNIKWIDKSDEGFIDRTHFNYRNYHFSVVNGLGTYGGINVLNGNNAGLLELMSNCVNCGEPIGSLTSDEAIEIVLDFNSSEEAGAFASVLLSHINTEAGENKSELSFEVINPEAIYEDEEDE